MATLSTSMIDKPTPFIGTLWWLVKLLALTLLGAAIWFTPIAGVILLLGVLDWAEAIQTMGLIATCLLWTALTVWLVDLEMQLQREEDPRTEGGTDMSGPGAGWYNDPEDLTSRRYWDGHSWTDSRVPKEAQRGGSREQSADGVIIAGYILAVLMPLIGFIIGLTQINKNRHGIWVVVVSIAAFLIFLAILSSAGSGSTNRYGY